MQKAVFLDRDGVINDNKDPVNKPADIKLYSWTAQAIKLLNEAGFHVYVVTNQGGIEMGYFTHEDLQSIHHQMLTELSKHEVRIHGVEYCPHFKTRCKCRKPKPGMILKIAKEHQIDLGSSYMVGDREMDIDAGRKAGCSTVKIGAPYKNADFRVDNLLEAAHLILSHDKAK